MATRNAWLDLLLNPPVEETISYTVPPVAAATQQGEDESQTYNTEDALGSKNASG